LIQGQLQLGAERTLNLHAEKSQASNHPGLALRSLAILLLSTLGYFAVVYGVSVGLFALAMVLKLPTWAQGAAGLGGAIAGIFIALGLSFAFAPLTMRRLLPVVPLENDEHRQTLDRCFDRAGIARPTYWVIRVDGLKSNNAFVTGFKNGRGWFRPALFITRPLLEQCSLEELRAIVLHEVSHLAANHLRKRFLFSFVAIFGSIVATGMILIAAQLFLPGPFTQITAIGAAVLAFALPFLAIRNQGRKQELEADLHAITKFGCSLHAMAGALRKIDRLNGLPEIQTDRATALSPDGGHPTTEERIIRLRQAVEFMLALDAASAKLEQESRADQDKKAA
jgi:Zn-dependent protease with chaperone function